MSSTTTNMPLALSTKHPGRTEVAGLWFDPFTEAACVEHVVTRAAAGEGGWVVTPNLDILRRCRRDPELRAFIQSAEVVVADGTPLIWASRLEGRPLPQRVCGSNLISSVSAAAAEQGLSIYLLGGSGDTASRAAEVLRRRHPNLRVAGVYYPEFGFERDESQIRAMAEAVRAARPDIIFVALTFPKGERLIERIRHAAPSAWWLGVGISFSFLCGEVRRAPRWMQRVGLEWLHRLGQEPRRLARRYLVDGLPFALFLLGRAIFTRMQGGSRQDYPD